MGSIWGWACFGMLCCVMAFLTIAAAMIAPFTLIIPLLMMIPIKQSFNDPL
jgi:hypothetical protein